MCAQTVGEFLDAGHPVVPAFGDDVGGAELVGEGLPVGVAAHRDDPLRTELPGGEHREEADGAVADDRDGLTGAGLGGNRAEPAGAEDVGRGEQPGDQVGVGHPGCRDEGAVGQGDTRELCLGADRAIGSAFTQRDW